MKLTTVLFDLDGTLLPMDQDEFVKTYFGLLAKKLAPHGYDPKKLVDGIWQVRSETYETGRLTHGTADPASPDFNSLADFIICGTGVEIRLPWQLLNFSNPAKMIIHDDYYQHYGAEDLHIDQLWVGIGREGDSITLASLPLKGWNTHVTCHARLKQSYWLLQDHWTKEAGA